MKAQHNENLDHIRHSCAHLLAAAVIDLFPKTKLTIGPAIENGFYYDFLFDKQEVKKVLQNRNKELKPLSENLESLNEFSFSLIEKKMAEILKNWNTFSHREVTEQEAREFYKDNPFKLELINEIVKKGEPITFYEIGGFEDLCRGGHSENPREDIKAFKLLSLAGAYWRGDEKNPMLTRIYGTCFPSQEELNQHLEMLEEIKKRDHRKLGQALDIFTISEDVGQGLILWLPNGTIIKDELEKWGKETEKKWGYHRVSTPHITKSGLYYTSGHLPYYKDDMYPPMIVDKNEEYYLKPMNCPHHHMIYKSRPRSYKDLPLRLAEFGTCYRYEASGELFGLMRVRGFTQNDSHIYCMKEQAVEEFVKVMKLHEYYYQTLGIKEYHLELGLRDPKNTKKYHGDEAMWQLAEKLMREAVKQTNIRMVEQTGSAAFYGPKIDFIIHSSIGREFAISTNQIDLYMGPRFNLKYTDTNGAEQTPVIIHRAPLGSDERFIGFLIEHFGGAFPTWLSPVQIVILPIADRHHETAKTLTKKLQDAGVRAELNNQKETLQAKIRHATLQKVPYMGIIGDKEREKGGVLSVRTRKGEDVGQVPLSDFLLMIQEEIDQKS